MRRLLLMLLMGVVAGCSQQDRESLAKVGRKMIEHLEDTAATSPDPFSSGIQAVRGSVGTGNLDCRIVLRLRWERELDGSAIRVRMTAPATVQLEGFLKDESQRARALELARGTSGVETIVDKMNVRPVNANGPREEAVEPLPEAPAPR